MRQKTEAALLRSMSISDYVNDQWTLLDLIKSVDEEKKSPILKLINEIEDIYAVAAATGSQLNSSDSNEIDQKLRQIKSLLVNFACVANSN